MTPSDTSWQLLPWDTSFFGFTVARINKPLTPDEFKQFQTWHDEQGVRCTYYLCPIDATDAIGEATACGFQFVDVRMLLECSKQNQDSVLSVNHSIRKAEADDVPELQKLAMELHRDSRFFADPRFPRDKARELYAMWIKRDSVDPQGLVWVKADSSNKSVGYLSCNVDGEQGQIGLFGVADEHQGRGIGSTLLRQGLHWFKQQGCQRIQVVTQGKNTGALGIYTSNGFRIKSMSVWLHHWTSGTGTRSTN